MSPSMKDHWNQIYSCRLPTQLGWYQDAPEASARLLEKCDIETGDPILDVGAGATVFIDYLLDQGFTNITAADISEVALSKLKERLGPERASGVHWIVDDIARSQIVQNMTDVALWHDRAVLHFLIEERDRLGYLETLEGVLRPGGYVIIAAFNTQGAGMCSGLPVRRYDANMLKELLGEDFTLLDHFDHVHHMPSGDPRPYVYTLFQKK